MASASGAIILLLAAALAAMPGDARKPKPLTGTLLLDMDSPIVTAEIGGVALRLRVAPEQKRLIELNRAAADRLDLPFEPGVEAQVGRETVAAITAGAQASIDGRRFMTQIASHERDCCAGVDGEIGITQLPYAVIRFVRNGAPPDLPQQQYLIEDSDERGPQARLRLGDKDIFATFSLTRQQSAATWAAGAMLAKAYGGKLDNGDDAMIEAAFGVKRPVRMLRLARPATVAGFSYATLPVRIGDFGGHHDLPRQDDGPTDIVVERHVSRQEAWPMVLVGRDRTDRCAEIRFDRISRVMTLACDFTARP